MVLLGRWHCDRIAGRANRSHRTAQHTRPTEQPSGQAGKSAAKLPATPGRGLLLLVKASEVPAEDPTVRVLTTAFGFLVLVLLLSLLNATLFQGAPQQSWRKRLPAIFVDVARFALIGIGLAVILSYIWGCGSVDCSPR